MPTIFQLRYRSPLAPTRGVDDVYLESDTDSVEAATEIARWWLETERANPATTLVYVRRMVVATSAEMRRAKEATRAATRAQLEAEDGPARAASASPGPAVPDTPAPLPIGVDQPADELADMAGAGSGRAKGKPSAGRIGQ